MVTDVELCEVNNHVYALRHAQINAVRNHWAIHEIAVPCHDGERMLLLSVLAGAEKNLIEAGGPAIENAEAVLPALHLEPGLDSAVNCVSIAQQSVSIQFVENSLPVLVKAHIVQNQRNIVFPAG